LRRIYRCVLDQVCTYQQCSVSTSLAVSGWFFLHSRLQVILWRQQVRVAETLLNCGWIWGFRFAKRKLDEYQFLGNLLQVSYAPNHETLADTHNKLEERRRTVLNRLKCKPPPR
jgi:hypothetical protein